MQRNNAGLLSIADIRIAIRQERLDFSCAIFSPDGGLVANAPHIPVHLGAMQEAVRFQLEYLKEKIYPGDVLVSNHPMAGGSHLPDITVMTPVFFPGHQGPVFFVASRGHHADIGGSTPGRCYSVGQPACLTTKQLAIFSSGFCTSPLISSNTEHSHSLSI